MSLSHPCYLRLVSSGTRDLSDYVIDFPNLQVGPLHEVVDFVWNRYADSPCPWLMDGFLRKDRGVGAYIIFVGETSLVARGRDCVEINQEKHSRVRASIKRSLDSICTQGSRLNGKGFQFPII